MFIALCRVLNISDEYTSEGKNLEQQIAAIDKNIEQLEDDLDKLENTAAAKKTEYEAAKMLFEKKRDKMLKTDNSIAGLLRSRDKITKDIEVMI